jgi:hypothetical protein
LKVGGKREGWESIVMHLKTDKELLIIHAQRLGGGSGSWKGQERRLPAQREKIVR